MELAEPSVHEQRRRLVAEDAKLRGLDSAEVLTRAAGRWSLAVRFVASQVGGKSSLPPGLGAHSFVVDLARSQSARVIGFALLDDVTCRVDLEGDATAAIVRLVRTPDIAPGFGSVTVGSDEERTPFDASSGGESPADSAHVDYLTKDYAGFRRLMLDRMASADPLWQERHPADIGVAIVEVLAYAADYLSYYQDAVATESYLGTARRRTSIARHARLLGYRVHDGCNARAWVHLEVEGSLTIPRGTAFIAKQRPAETSVASIAAFERVFEALEDTAVDERSNSWRLYDHGVRSFVLERGATSAALYGASARIAAGDVLIFEELREPAAGGAPRTEHRQAVRVVQVVRTTDRLTRTGITRVDWDAADALRFDLVVASPAVRDRRPLAHALGNVVPVDHGETIAGVRPLVLTRRSGWTYARDLRFGDLTFAAPYDVERLRAKPAVSFDAYSPAGAGAQLSLAATMPDGTGLQTWYAVPDLIDATPVAAAFAVQTEDDGSLSLRFGDCRHGRIPDPRRSFVPTYRTGGGLGGNVGSDTIVEMRSDDVLARSVHAVRNPLPATGGVDPERIDEVVRDAPALLRRQERCVNDADVLAAARAIAGVADAAVRRRFTGSWTTIEVSVRKRGAPGSESAALLAAVRAQLLPMRMAGTDMIVRAPRYVPIFVEIELRVAPGAHAPRVERAAADAVARVLAQTHRDFGQPFFISPLLAAVMDVNDVLDARAVRFRRAGAPPSTEASLPMRGWEIARLDPVPRDAASGSWRIVGAQ